MHVGAGLSQDRVGARAAEGAADRAAAALVDEPTLVVVFVSAAHRHDFDGIADAVRRRLGPDVLLGAVTAGVIGPDGELESGPAVAVLAADLDGGQAIPFRAWALPQRGGGRVVTGWPDAHPDDLVLLLADPYTFPTERLLDHVARSRRRETIAGGLVTAGRGASALLLDGRTHADGAVGVVLRDVDADVIVSQGCRPVGTPMTVTRAHGNVVVELAGERATDRLQQTFDEASPADRDLLRTALRVGVVADDYQEDFDVGDFVILDVLGADEASGGVAVSAAVQVGRTIQFQVLDPTAADTDLQARVQAESGPVAASLLFSCSGRGRRLFGAPDHDLVTVRRAFAAPVIGAFCAGEIGPLGDRSWLHGFTAVVTVLRGAVP